jgi:hypothetical protein
MGSIWDSGLSSWDGGTTFWDFIFSDTISTGRLLKILPESRVLNIFREIRTLIINTENR